MGNTAGKKLSATKQPWMQVKCHRRKKGNAPCSTQVFSRCFATALSAVATCDLVIGLISAAHCISFLGKHSEDPSYGGCVPSCTCQREGRLSSWWQSSAISHQAAATWWEGNLPGAEWTPWLRFENAQLQNSKSTEEIKQPLKPIPQFLTQTSIYILRECLHEAYFFTDELCRPWSRFVTSINDYWWFKK